VGVRAAPQRDPRGRGLAAGSPGDPVGQRGRTGGDAGSPATSPREQPRAFVIARRAYGAFLVAMAAVNVVLAASDLQQYSAFADEALLPLYRDLWATVVTPNVEVLVPLLIGFELAVGLTLWWARARALRVALWLVVAFHLALVPANPYAAWNLLLVLVPLGLLWWHRALSTR
jgi:hypothetical protein